MSSIKLSRAKADRRLKPGCAAPGGMTALRRPPARGEAVLERAREGALPRARIPGATYRLQVNGQQPLSAVIPVLDYLQDLGITDLYCSPLSQAVPGSGHGYDVCAPDDVSAEVGGLPAFEDLASHLRRRGLGVLLDIVPNHMAASPHNPWWWDVLKHGRASQYASFFDIDWDRDDPDVRGRVLLPVLGKPLAEVIQAGELLVSSTDGEPVLRYFDQTFPLAPAASGAPASTSKSALRDSPSAIIELLSRQHYCLCHWRLGSRKINYRRFFDVTGLVALRMEDPQVFAATHAQVREWLRSGRINGLRVDHPDGLRDPGQYLERLMALRTGEGTPPYVVVEKILAEDETLPRPWPVHGTTGYDFLNDVNQLFVARENQEPMTRLYQDFTGCSRSFDDLVHESKKRVLESSFAAEVDALVRLLLPHSPQVTAADLGSAIVGIASHLPVYRTYVRAGSSRLSPADAQVLDRAVARARSGTIAPSALDFVRSILALRVSLPASGATAAREFILRCQQLTGPAAAKGIEDSAFYQFNRLVSLNEVGGNPARFGLSVQGFHRRNQRRLREWPHSLLATSTHDTKRGEDVRARLDVLSEMPAQWRRAVGQWQEWNRAGWGSGADAPDANDEYLLYQTLVGAWDEQQPLDVFRDRIAAYMNKAVREAGRHTSWTDPDDAYESAMRDFVNRVLHPRNERFLADLRAFARSVAFFGQFNSLSQTLLKIASPGVPDFYQGSELWNLSLVDPDNRRPVDFAACRRLLSGALRETDPSRFLLTCSAESKLYLIARALRHRNEHRGLFDRGAYVPLRASGPAAAHLCAFARRHGGEMAVVVVPRLLCTLLQGREELPLGRAAWGATAVRLPARCRAAAFTNVLGGGSVEARGGVMLAADLFHRFPVALLHPAS